MVALWWPEEPTEKRVEVLSPQKQAPSNSSAGSLPATLPRQAFESAEFDPFVGAQATPPPTPTPVKAPAVVEAPPPLPSPPPARYRYLGQMTDPSGAKRMFVGKDDAMIPIEVGVALDDGYVVDAIETDAIRLRHPSTGTLVSITVPPPEDDVRR